MRPAQAPRRTGVAATLSVAEALGAGPAAWGGVDLVGTATCTKKSFLGPPVLPGGGGSKHS